MNATAFIRNLPASPILSDRDHWLFDGPGVDPFVAHCQADAEARAAELNSDRQKYAVLRFNAVDGLCRDVTHEFWRAPDEEPEDAEPTRADRIAANRMAGMYR